MNYSNLNERCSTCLNLDKYSAHGNKNNGKSFQMQKHVKFQIYYFNALNQH